MSISIMFKPNEYLIKVKYLNVEDGPHRERDFQLEQIEEQSSKPMAPAHYKGTRQSKYSDTINLALA